MKKRMVSFLMSFLMALSLVSPNIQVFAKENHGDNSQMQGEILETSEAGTSEADITTEASEEVTTEEVREEATTEATTEEATTEEQSTEETVFRGRGFYGGHFNRRGSYYRGKYRFLYG